MYIGSVPKTRERHLKLNEIFNKMALALKLSEKGLKTQVLEVYTSISSLYINKAGQ